MNDSSTGVERINEPLDHPLDPNYINRRSRELFNEKKQKTIIENRQYFENVIVCHSSEDASNWYQAFHHVIIDHKHRVRIYLGASIWGRSKDPNQRFSWLSDIGMSLIEYRRYNAVGLSYNPLVPRLWQKNEENSANPVTFSVPYFGYDVGILQIKSIVTNMTLAEFDVEFRKEVPDDATSYSYLWVLSNYPLTPEDAIVSYPVDDFENFIFDNFDNPNNQLFEQLKFDYKNTVEKKERERDEQTSNKSWSQENWIFNPQLATTYFGNIGWFTPATFQFWGNSIELFKKYGVLCGSISDTLIRDGNARSFYTIERTPIVLLMPEAAFGRQNDVEKYLKKYDVKTIHSLIRKELEIYTAQFLSFSPLMALYYNGKEFSQCLLNSFNDSVIPWGSDIMEIANRIEMRVIRSWITRAITYISLKAIGGVIENSIPSLDSTPAWFGMYT